METKTIHQEKPQATLTTAEAVLGIQLDLLRDRFPVGTRVRGYGVDSGAWYVGTVLGFEAYPGEPPHVRVRMLSSERLEHQHDWDTPRSLRIDGLERLPEKEHDF